MESERDKDKIINIERFGDDYFALVAKNSKSENAVLAHQPDGQELIIRLRGRVYRIK